MSKFDLAGHDLKDWAMIMLLGSLSFVIAIVGISFFLAIRANPSAITLTGSFDISQFVAIIVAIAAVAIVFVGQQLTARQVTNAIKQNDETWQTDTPSTKPPGT